MDGETNTAQQVPQVQRDSGPGPLDVLQAQMTLHQASTHQQERQTLEHLQLMVEQVLAGQAPVHGLPRRLQSLALDLEQQLAVRRLLENLQHGGQL